MRTISQILADLLKAIEEKDTEKQKTYRNELTEAEATMGKALKKANSEAKESREKVESLEKDIEKLKEKEDPDDTEDPEKEDDPKDDPKPKDDDPKMAKFEKILEKQNEVIESLKKKLDDQETEKATQESKAALAKSLNKALEDAKIPEKQRELFKKRINVSDLKHDAEDLEDSLKERITDFQQEINDQILELTGKPFIPTGELGGEDGAKIAEARNSMSKAGGSVVAAKPLIGIQNEGKNE
jgi:DNA repair exonuclease SbcCD ATPase subunit